MGICVRIESENGDVEAEVSDPAELTQNLLPEGSDAAWPCLGFVDRSGATVFNQLQVPLLINDLQRRLAELDDPDIREHADQILELITSVEGQQRTFVRFIGD